MSHRDRGWREGDRVRFVRAYDPGVPVEYGGVFLAAGTEGVIVARNEDSLLVAVEMLAEPVKIWFEAPQVKPWLSTALLAPAPKLTNG